MVTDASTRSGHLFTLDPARAYPVLDRADGVWVWDTAGNQYLDAIAGIAVVNIGYGRTEVAEAVGRQAARLPFAVANIFANEPAIELAGRISSITPGDLDYVHFTSGGSEAVEVAIKIARQYHVLHGRPERDLVMARWTSYHGATLAALSATGSRLRRKMYEPMLLPFPHIPPSYCYRCPFGKTYPSCEVACATELERAIAEVGADRIAAFIAEPIVASVGGTLIPVPEYYEIIRETCDRHGILFICDEIVTGIGRTGRNFGIDHWGVVPDMITMGKGVSGGYAPLGAVAVRAEIRAAFADAGSAFEHIFTFGGNPVSMAAGNAVLAIWDREGLVENVRRNEAAFAAELEKLRRFAYVGDVRSIGFMAGIEFVADRATKEPYPLARRVGALVREAGLRNGIVTYPGSGMTEDARGDIISLYPPLTFGPAEIAEMGLRLGATFEEVDAQLQAS